MYGWTRQTEEAFSDGFDRGTGIMIAQLSVAQNKGLIKIKTRKGNGVKALFETFMELDNSEVENFFLEMVKSRLGI